MLVDPELAAAVRPELARGETLVWAGRPQRLALAWSRGGKLALIMIPFTGFAAIWTLVAFVFAGAGPDGEADAFGALFPLFGFLFMGVGLFLFGRAVVNMLGGGGTVYAVTSQRALALDGKGSVTSWGPDEVATIQRRARGRRGDLVFTGQGPQHQGEGRYSQAMSLGGFTAIERPREVEQLIRDHVVRRERAA